MYKYVVHYLSLSLSLSLSIYIYITECRHKIISPFDMLSTSPEIAGTPQAYAGWPQQNVYPTVQPSISGYNQPSNGYMTPSFYTVSQPRRLSLSVFAVHVEMKI